MLARCILLFSIFAAFSPQGAAEPIIGGEFVGKLSNVNGQVIVQHENKYPYMVHLLLSTEDSSEEEEKQQCGGILIGSQTVLTAAHCITSIEDKPRIEVRAGILHLLLEDGKAQNRLMEKYLIHEEYVLTCATGKKRFHFCRNDIALIWVAKPFKFAASVQPAVLGSKASVFNNVVGVILGWGYTEKGTSSLMLRQAEQKVVPLAVCKKEYNNTLFDKSKLCIISASKTSVICYGDSGGPFVANGVLYGIGSFASEGECDPKRASVFTNVAHFENWIKSSIQKWSPKELKLVSFEEKKKKKWFPHKSQ